MPIKRTRLLNRKIDFRDAKLFIIATEGEKTEKQYFNLFENSKIRVVVIPSESEKSAHQQTRAMVIINRNARL